MTDEQRIRLTKLLAAELTRAWDAALAGGADPRRLTAVVEHRRRALRAHR